MDVSSNRLFRFSKPEWLNNSAVRNGGVYIAGALVSPDAPISRPTTPCQDAANDPIVRRRILLPNRRRIFLA